MWTATDQKWDSVPKTHKELSQKKQFLKPNGVDLRVSGMLKQNPTVSSGHKGIGINWGS
jgi:hypothetical protein